MDRYRFSTHKESGITNYPLEGVGGEDVRAIVERLMHVGVESDRIMAMLSKHTFEMPKEGSAASQ